MTGDRTSTEHSVGMEAEGRNEPKPLPAVAIDRLRGLAGAATPGPWTVDDNQCVTGRGGVIVADYSCHARGTWEADAAYIAALSPEVFISLIPPAPDAIGEEKGAGE